MPDTLTPAALTLDPPASAPARVRLEYLDGVRALAALAVVFYHALCNVIWAPPGFRPDAGGLPPAWMHALGWIKSGNMAVGVFIVLSGYCLMLPVARDPEGALRGGALGFLARRARRILPPYYAALAAALLLIGLVPGLHHREGVRWDDVLPAFTPGVLVSHLLLLHDLREGWIHKVCSPLWSIAVEWQIYFLLPLLAWLWRRGGLAGLLAGGFVLGVGGDAATHHHYAFAHPWYVFEFALGAAGAAVGFGAGRLPTLLRERVPWGAVSAASAAVLLLHLNGRLERPGAFWRQDWAFEAVIGLAASALLVSCSRSLAAGRGHAAARLFAWRPLVALGGFSYSLYLVHDLVLGPFDLALRRLGASPAAHLVGLFLVGVPLAVAGAYAFHLAFERPFMPGRPRTERGAEAAAAVSPAP